MSAAISEILLISGLIFPVVSLLSFIASTVTRWRYDRYASPVFIPLIGPALLTCWVIFTAQPLWLVPLVWLGDLGTIAFLFALPTLTREWWRTSRFTRLMTLNGSQGIEVATISLHRNGHYLMRKSWHREHGDLGIVEMGETGTYMDHSEVIVLESHFGLTRQLRRVDDTTFDVAEIGHDDLETQVYSLHCWRLTCNTTMKK